MKTIKKRICDKRHYTEKVPNEVATTYGTTAPLRSEQRGRYFSEIQWEDLAQIARSKTGRRNSVASERNLYTQSLLWKRKKEKEKKKKRNLLNYYLHIQLEFSHIEFSRRFHGLKCPLHFLPILLITTSLIRSAYKYFVRSSYYDVPQYIF